MALAPAWVVLCAALSSTSCILSFDGLSGDADGGATSGGATAGGAAGSGAAGGAGAAAGGTGNATSGGTSGAGGFGGGAAGAAGMAGNGGSAGATGGTAGNCNGGLCECCGSGGGCGDKQLESTLGSSLGKSRQRVAVISQDVYWTRQGAEDALVRQRPGGSPEVVFSANYPESVVAQDGWLVWSDSSGLFRCRADQCESTATRFFASGVVNDRQVLALSAGTLYWLIGSNDNDRQLVSCPLAGCAAGSESVIVSNRATIRGISANSTHLYWSEEDASAIYRLALGQSSGAPPTFLTNLDHPTDLVVTDTQLFWAEQGDPGDIRYCDLSNCVPKPVAPNAPLQHPVRTPAALAVTAGRIYWSNLLSDSVMSCPLPACSGGELPELVATNKAYPYGVSVGDSCVAFHSGDADGAVWLAPARPQ